MQNFLSEHFVSAQSLQDKQQRLASGISALDQFLEGGLPWGTLIEWGMPIGFEGRNVLLAFLVGAMQEEGLVLWVNGHASLSVFPPPWFARGLLPHKMVFCDAESPLKILKRAIVNPLFKVIIIDSPTIFSVQDAAFLRRQAASCGQLMVLVRNYFLSNKLGNPWARLRLNCRRQGCGYLLQVMRGQASKRLFLDQGVLE